MNTEKEYTLDDLKPGFWVLPIYDEFEDACLYATWYYKMVEEKIPVRLIEGSKQDRIWIVEPVNKKYREEVFEMVYCEIGEILGKFDSIKRF